MSRNPDYGDEDYYEETDQPGHPRPQRRPLTRRLRLDINELPIWTWVAILLVVVVFGGALWMMTRDTDESVSRTTASPAPVESPFATLAPAVEGITTPTVIVSDPTPGVSIPTEIAVGVRAIVTGTGQSNLRVRAGASTEFATLVIIEDGTELQVLAGPESGAGHTWWQVELPDGTKGWVVQQFIAPIGR